ncbi:MAG TPA: two-component sensor histidine kinase [Sulfurospirillum arcachonense]|nr:two-component sensor histidine kinase [Sulfurospirillum arcachonense]
MINNLTIKTKLLLSTIIIQAVTLFIFGFGLYKAVEITTIEGVKSNLRVIMLDIVDDILSHKKLLANIDLDEAEEVKFRPLFIRIIEPKSKKILVSTHFPKSLNTIDTNYKIIDIKKIVFSEEKGYIISRTKVEVKKGIKLVIEIATQKSIINVALDNLLYILALVLPFIFIISFFGTYALLKKSFKPIEIILNNLRNIQATNLSKRIQTNNTDDEINQLTTEINNLLNRLESSFEKIEQFSSDASHELKTPLTIIRGELEIALNKDRTLKEYKETIRSSLDEILTIQYTIDDLLFLAKIEQNDTQKEIVYLDEISLEIINELSHFAQISSIELNYSIKEALQSYGISNLLKIAISNILKNAISFSSKDSQVFLENYSDASFNYICIKDSGIGIEASEQKKIFESFYRTDKSRSKHSGGSGLGMAICQKITQLHKGTILIDSEVNKGSKICIKLPKAKLQQ